MQAAGMRSEIVTRRDELDAAEVAALEISDDPLAQVQTKYSP